MPGLFSYAAKLVAEGKHWTKTDSVEYLNTIKENLGGKIELAEDKSYAYWIYPNNETEKGDNIIYVMASKAVIEGEETENFPIEWNILFKCDYGDNGKLYFERSYLINPPTIKSLKEWITTFVSLRGLSNYSSEMAPKPSKMPKKKSKKDEDEGEE